MAELFVPFFPLRIFPWFPLIRFFLSISLSRMFLLVAWSFVLFRLLLRITLRLWSLLRTLRQFLIIASFALLLLQNFSLLFLYWFLRWLQIVLLPVFVPLLLVMSSHGMIIQLVKVIFLIWLIFDIYDIIAWVKPLLFLSLHLLFKHTRVDCEIATLILMKSLLVRIFANNHIILIQRRNTLLSDFVLFMTQFLPVSRSISFMPRLITMLSFTFKPEGLFWCQRSLGR